MKILTVVGERPAFLRLIPTLKKLPLYFDHKFVWVNQNFDPSLSSIFFKEFNIKPDISFKNDKMGIEYVSSVLPWLEKVYLKEKPDAVLILGDTHASFCAAYMAKRLNLTLFHCEAGNRSFDIKRVPEEVNRMMIDSISDWHLVYTQRSREHLLLENKRPDRIIVIGNPLVELIKEHINKNPKFVKEDYYLSTLHRRENITNRDRLISILTALNDLDLKVKLSFHPSLEDAVYKFNIKIERYKNIECFTPCNYGGFIDLEANAACIISDSGGIPEEANILGIPCILLRYSTERPELLESNSMVMCSNPEHLKLALNIALNETNFQMTPPEYHLFSSSIIIKLLMRAKDD
jgi:UDP-N-acetylglucosamine 2-epimerase (non-hydrolysing)